MYNNEPKKSRGSLKQFILGMILLAVGLFWLFSSIRVTTGFGYGGFFGLSGIHVPSGVVVVPLLIGIAMLFLMERKVFGFIVTAVGVAVIAVAVISSVHLYFMGQSLWSYILMLSFIIVGAALVLKNLF